MPTTTTHRGIDARLQKGWAHAIEKENTLRLKWFRTNEARLNEIANKPPSKAVPEEVKTEFEKNRIESYQNMAKFPRLKAKEPDLIELAALKGIMRPVDPAVKKLIYTGLNKDGRMNYLNKRVELIPERRYYFIEVSSWEYGWNILDSVKEMRNLGFGRQQVIKESFYRRRGVGRDPEWYKDPIVFRPSICSNS